jgi:LysM domain-containing protein
MSTMSAAEAKLDADIRPEITVLRSRSSYPNRRRPADQAGGEAYQAGAGAHLTLLAARAVGPASAEPDDAASGPRPEPARPVRSVPAPGPIRLTRRGRVVVAMLSILAAAAVAWLVASSQAQASGHASHQGGSGGMTRVVVQPGATLWSIAVRVDPGADPRAVIQQIMGANTLSSASIQAGQVLWVPRG